MHPITFKEVNVVYAENQKEYTPLPVCVKANGIVVACWKLSLKERLKVLFSGVIWHEMMPFGGPLQPQRLAVKKPVIE